MNTQRKNCIVTVLVLGALAAAGAQLRSDPSASDGTYVQQLAELTPEGVLRKLDQDIGGGTCPLARDGVVGILRSTASRNGGQSRVVDWIRGNMTDGPLAEILLGDVRLLLPEYSSRRDALLEAFHDDKKSMGIRKRALRMLTSDPRFDERATLESLLSHQGVSKDEMGIVASAWSLYSETHPDDHESVDLHWLREFVEENGEQENFADEVYSLFAGCETEAATEYLAAAFGSTPTDRARQRKRICHTAAEIAGGVDSLLIRQPMFIGAVLDCSVEDARHLLSGMGSESHAALEREFLATVGEDLVKRIGLSRTLNLAMVLGTRKGRDEGDNGLVLIKDALRSGDPGLRLAAYKHLVGYFGSVHGAFDFVRPFAANEKNGKCREFLAMQYSSGVFAVDGELPFARK